MKKYILITIFSVAALFVLLLTVKGLRGNPTEKQINTNQWKESGPFELSPERGRFALMYSIVENNSVHFSIPIAQFVAPDVAYSHGNYVSLFSPGLSYLIIPGYILGKAMGNSQVGAFYMISIFAVINMILIWAIVKKLTNNSVSGILSGLIFLFATPAFVYAGTLYQHHVTTFIILSSIYLLMRSQSILTIGLVLFFCAFSIPLDNPNAIFLFPIATYALIKLVTFESVDSYVKLHFRYLGVFSIMIATIPLLLLLIYNNASHNQPFKLSGTLAVAKQINEDGTPVTSEDQSNSAASFDERAKTKTTSGLFKSRDLMNGMYVHLFSHDRGVIFFTPIVLFGLLGFVKFPKEQKEIKAVMSGTMAAIFLLYSLWGDPWGGWAFADRYMIPAYALLCIFLGTALKSISKNYLVAIVFTIVLIYSVAINTLGAVTTSANPPEGEAKALSQISGKDEKYGYDRNWEYLNSNGSKSFFYRTYLSKTITPYQFYIDIVVLILLLILPLYFYYTFTIHKE
jgi:hypothetical protein